MHKRYESCVGEWCTPCARVELPVPAMHKLGEEIMDDDEQPERHNLTAYVCCHHFRLIVGGKGSCEVR